MNKIDKLQTLPSGIINFHSRVAHLFIYFIYIPWIIRGKSHVDTGKVNIDMNATRQMYLNINTIML